jgi:hypothetical protein
VQGEVGAVCAAAHVKANRGSPTAEAGKAHEHLCLQLVPSQPQFIFTNECKGVIEAPVRASNFILAVLTGTGLRYILRGDTFMCVAETRPRLARVISYRERPT